MYLVFGVVDLGFGNVYAVHCSVYYIWTLKYIDAFTEQRESGLRSFYIL